MEEGVSVTMWRPTGKSLPNGASLAGAWFAGQKPFQTASRVRKMPGSGNDRDRSGTQNGTRHATCKMQTRPKKTIFLDHIPPQPGVTTSPAYLNQPQQQATGQASSQSWATKIDTVDSREPKTLLISNTAVVRRNIPNESRNGSSHKPSLDSLQQYSRTAATKPASEACTVTQPRRNNLSLARSPDDDDAVFTKPKVVARDAFVKGSVKLCNGHARETVPKAKSHPKSAADVCNRSRESSLAADRPDSKRNAEVIFCATFADVCQHIPVLRQCLVDKVVEPPVQNGKKYNIVMPLSESRQRSASPPVTNRGNFGARERTEQGNKQQRQFNGFVVPHADEPIISSKSPNNNKIAFDLMRTYQNIDLPAPKSGVTGNRAPLIRSGSTAVVPPKIPPVYFLRPAFVVALPSLTNKPKNGCLTTVREQRVVVNKDIVGACDSVCAPGKRRADSGASGGVTTNIKQSYFYQCFFCSFQQPTEALNSSLKLCKSADMPSSSSAISGADIYAANAPYDPDFERFLTHLRQNHRIVAEADATKLRAPKSGIVALEFACDFKDKLLLCRVMTKKPNGTVDAASNGHAFDGIVVKQDEISGGSKSLKLVEHETDERSQEFELNSDGELEQNAAAQKSPVKVPARKATRRVVSLQHPKFGNLASSAITIKSSASKFDAAENSTDGVAVEKQLPTTTGRTIRFNRCSSSSSSSSARAEVDSKIDHSPSTSEQRRVGKHMGVGPILLPVDIDHGPEKCPIDGCNFGDYNSRRRSETTLLDFYHHLMEQHVPATPNAAATTTTTADAEMRCKWHDCIDSANYAESSGGNDADNNRRHLRNSNSIDRLRQHYLLHLGPRPFRCALKGCQKRFDDPNRFANHMNFCEKNPLRKSVAEQQQQNDHQTAAKNDDADDEMKFFNDIVPSYGGEVSTDQHAAESSRSSLVRHNSVSLRRTYSSSAHLFATAARGATETTTNSVLPPADLHAETLTQTDEYRKSPNILFPAWRVQGFEQLGVNEFPASFYVQYWHVSRQRQAEISMPIQFELLDQHLIAVQRFRLQFFRCLQHLLVREWSAYFGALENDAVLQHQNDAVSSDRKKRRAGTSSRSKSPFSSASNSTNTPNKRTRRDSPRSRSPPATAAAAPKLSHAQQQASSSPLPVLHRESLIYSLMYNGYSSLSLTWPYFMCQRKVITWTDENTSHPRDSTVISHEPAVLLPETILTEQQHEPLRANESDQNKHATSSRNFAQQQNAPLLVMSPPDSSSTTCGSFNAVVDAENSALVIDDSMLFKMPAAASNRNTTTVKVESLDLSCTSDAPAFTTQMYNSFVGAKVGVDSSEPSHSTHAVRNGSETTGRTASASASGSSRITTSAAVVKNVAIDIDPSNEGVLLPQNLHPKLRLLINDAYRMAAESPLPPAFYPISITPSST